MAKDKKDEVNENKIDVSKGNLDSKTEKKKRFFDEIKAFLILIVIVFVVGFGFWYWYSKVHSNEENSNKEETTISEYNVIKYNASEDSFLSVIGDEYLVEYSDDTISKIMDMNANVLYSGEIENGSVISGIDNNLYVYVNDDGADENIITLYRIVEKDTKEIKTIVKDGVDFVPIYSYDDDVAYLVGFGGISISYDNEQNEVRKTYIYAIDGEEYEIDGYSIQQSEIIEDSYTLFDDKYLIVLDTNNKYGLYNLDSGELLIDAQYDGLYTDENDNFVVVKENKAGIISAKMKILVDFEYDFIDSYDDYYVVSKNGKMAIMDNEYNLVTDFDFDYQTGSLDVSFSYLECCSLYNTFKSYKVNDKYILTINYGEIYYGIEYSKHETYIIDEDGIYRTITSLLFDVNEETGLIYSYDDETNKYVVYDEDLKEKYKLDVSSYDYSGVLALSLVNGKTIVLGDNNLYFDYETGEELDSEPDFTTEVNGITIKYDSDGKVLEYLCENCEEEVLATLNLDAIGNDSGIDSYYEIIDDNCFYYYTSKYYIKISKVS